MVPRKEPHPEAPRISHSKQSLRTAPATSQAPPPRLLGCPPTHKTAAESLRSSPLSRAQQGGALVPSPAAGRAAQPEAEAEAACAGGVYVRAHGRGVCTCPWSTPHSPPVALGLIKP